MTEQTPSKPAWYNLLDAPATSLLFRRIKTYPDPANERHWYTVKIFVGPKGSRQDAGQFLCSASEWASLEPSLRAAGDVEVMS